jgi:hypothetical protein
MAIGVREWGDFDPADATDEETCPCVTGKAGALCRACSKQRDEDMAVLRRHLDDLNEVAQEAVEGRFGPSRQDAVRTALRRQMRAVYRVATGEAL